MATYSKISFMYNIWKGKIIEKKKKQVSGCQGMGMGVGV